MVIDTTEVTAIPNWPQHYITNNGRVCRLTVKWLKGRDVGCKVLAATIGPCPTGKECCHKNDNYQDNRSENLYWGTHLENANDAVRNGRGLGRPPGQGSVLNALQVRVIHHLLESGEFTNRAIARIFGLTDHKGGVLIGEIKHGRAWESVTGRSRKNVLY